VPEHGGLCDLLWSDPSLSTSPKWEENGNRKCSYYFGVNQARSFLNRNGLKLIIRGHEVDPQGFRYQTALNVPLTLTIFSAPNYSHKNRGSVAEISV
jgi:serine/threonine-protein phosphatase 2B catalytic subunit